MSIISLCLQSLVCGSNPGGKRFMEQNVKQPKNNKMTALKTAKPVGRRCAGQSIKQPKRNKMTADRKVELIEAAKKGETDVIREFLEQQKLRKKDMKNTCQKLFRQATDNSQVEILRLLLRHGCVTANKKDEKGWSFLHVAADRGNTETCELLLQHDADINATTDEGHSSLHLAAGKGNDDTCQVLLNSGADVNRETNQGWTSLHCAVTSRNAEVCELLLNHKADVDAATNEGWTSLHLSCRYGLLDVCQQMVNRGPDMELKDKQGMRAVDVAALNGSTECCVLLVSIMEEQAYEFSIAEVLHHAVEGCSEDTIRGLIEHGANVNDKGLDGNTAIHVAARCNRSIPVIVLLHKEGCNLAALNAEGRTAKQIALEHQNLNVHCFLSMLEQQLQIKYPLEGKGQGEVLIINNQNYCNRKYPSRTGSENDVASLLKTFEKTLEYNVDIHTNLTFTRMATAVWTFANKPSMKEASVVFVIILAHGSGNILGVDAKRSINAYDIAELLCKQQHLAGKPKIIITQACRGTRENNGIDPFDPVGYTSITYEPSMPKLGGKLRARGDGCPEKVFPDVAMSNAPRTDLFYRVSDVRPAVGDFIIAESTVPGCQSYRDGSGKGSIFIQALCKILEEDSHNLCFQDILTKVSQLVVERFEVPNGAKMQPMFSSALNGKLFLNPCGKKDHYYGVPVPNLEDG